ncbi:hypothetical protein VTI74DRAFT_9687 [Chaetomium olivicolor]
MHIREHIQHNSETELGRSMSRPDRLIQGMSLEDGLSGPSTGLRLMMFMENGSYFATMRPSAVNVATTLQSAMSTSAHPCLVPVDPTRFPRVTPAGRCSRRSTVVMPTSFQNDARRMLSTPKPTPQKTITSPSRRGINIFRGQCDAPIPMPKYRSSPEAKTHNGMYTT